MLSPEEARKFREEGVLHTVGNARKTGMVIEGVAAAGDRNHKILEHALNGARLVFAKLSLPEQHELQDLITGARRFRLTLAIAGRPGS